MPEVQVYAEHRGLAVQQIASVAPTVFAADGLCCCPVSGSQVWKAHAPVIAVQHWVGVQAPPVHAVLATAEVAVYPDGQLYVEHVG
jgi:hypothetical protein